MRGSRAYADASDQAYMYYKQLVEAEAAREAEYAHCATLFDNLVAFGPYLDEGLAALQQAQHDGQRFVGVCEELVASLQGIANPLQHLAACGLGKTALSSRAGLGWNWSGMHWAIAFMREQQQLGLSVHVHMPSIVETLLGFLVEVVELVGSQAESKQPEAHVVVPVVSTQEVVEASVIDESFEEARSGYYAAAREVYSAASCDQALLGGDIEATDIEVTMTDLSFEPMGLQKDTVHTPPTNTITFASIATHFKSDKKHLFANSHTKMVVTQIPAPHHSFAPVPPPKMVDTEDVAIDSSSPSLPDPKTFTSESEVIAALTSDNLKTNFIAEAKFLKDELENKQIPKEEMLSTLFLACSIIFEKAEEKWFNPETIIKGEGVQYMVNAIDELQGDLSIMYGGMVKKPVRKRLMESLVRATSILESE